MEKKNIAGMSLKGGGKDRFYFCLLEYFPDTNRWFLKSLLKVKDEEGIDGDDAIRSWINQYDVKQLVVDFPLSFPVCQTCSLSCPGMEQCPEPSVVEVRQRVADLLQIDKNIHEKHPKTYERDRNQDDQNSYCKNIMQHKTSEHLLSRSFKRRLKKGYLPYWNRSIDFWVWAKYYDQLLDFFNISFDSFGNTSLMILSRFPYLRRHLPDELELFEGNMQLSLLELLRTDIIHKYDINKLFDLECAIEGRLDIIKKIEAALNIFIYDPDLENICKNPRAFNSFIMAIVGQNIHMGENQKLPDWTYPEKTKFIVPCFSSFGGENA